MDFLYFEPNVNLSQVPDDLKYAFDRRPCFHQVTGNGPGNSSGTLLCGGAYHVQSHRIGYYPDRQTWTKVPGVKRWIGYYTDEPPTPDDLARSEQLRSHLVVLSGQQWKVPIARAFERTDDGGRFVISLPRVFDLSDDGEWVSGQIVDEFQPLWQAASRWWDFMAAGIPDNPTVATHIEAELTDFVDDCVTALAVNYRLSKVECHVLKLFRDDTFTDVLAAIVDMPSMNAFSEEKKKQVQNHQAA